MNTRRKGQRTFLKAMRFALSFPGTVVVPLYQVSRFAQPQPFDAILFREGALVRLVEVRTGQWGVGKPPTRQLACLPGVGHLAQIWRFRRGATTPDIRQWMGGEAEWVVQDHPWEGG